MLCLGIVEVRGSVVLRATHMYDMTPPPPLHVLTRPLPVLACVRIKAAGERQKSFVAGQIMEALRASQADSVTGRSDVVEGNHGGHSFRYKCISLVLVEITSFGVARDNSLRH